MRAVSLGLRYVNIPLRPWSALTSEQAREVLWQLIGHPQERIFIHCRRGKDRTGTAIACYRVQHDKWSNARALEEADSFGMSQFRAGHAFVHPRVFAASGCDLCAISSGPAASDRISSLKYIHSTT